MDTPADNIHPSTPFVDMLMDPLGAQPTVIGYKLREHGVSFDGNSFEVTLSCDVPYTWADHFLDVANNDPVSFPGHVDHPSFDSIVVRNADGDDAEQWFNHIVRWVAQTNEQYTQKEDALLRRVEELQRRTTEIFQQYEKESE